MRIFIGLMAFVGFWGTLWGVSAARAEVPWAAQMVSKGGFTPDIVWDGNAYTVTATTGYTSTVYVEDPPSAWKFPVSHEETGLSLPLHQPRPTFVGEPGACITNGQVGEVVFGASYYAQTQAERYPWILDYDLENLPGRHGLNGTVDSWSIGISYAIVNVGGKQCRGVYTTRSEKRNITALGCLPLGCNGEAPPTDETVDAWIREQIEAQMTDFLHDETGSVYKKLTFPAEKRGTLNAWFAPDQIEESFGYSAYDDGLVKIMIERTKPGQVFPTKPCPEALASDSESAGCPEIPNVANGTGRIERWTIRFLQYTVLEELHFTWEDDYSGFVDLLTSSYYGYSLSRNADGTWKSSTSLLTGQQVNDAPLWWRYGGSQIAHYVTLTLLVGFAHGYAETLRAAENFRVGEIIQRLSELGSTVTK